MLLMTAEKKPEAMSHTDLFQMACPRREDVPFFNHCMSIAKARGMSWEEGLLFTIEQRGVEFHGC